MSESGTDLAVTLGDVAAEPIEQTGPTSNFVYVDISSIDRESKRIVGEKEISAVNAPSRAKQILRVGDVLVSMTRPNLNAVSIVPDRLDGAIASTGFHVLRSKWVEPKFLFNLVQTDEFIDSMCNVVQGALYPAVRPKDIASFAFTLPSSNQQTRIVEKLEELLSDLDAGVAELKAAQAKLVRYRQSLLKAAVEGALTAEWRQHNTPEETGAQLLQRILTERRVRWEAKQLTKFAEQSKAPPKDWQRKYPEPMQPDIADLPELPDGWIWTSVDALIDDGPQNGLYLPTSRYGRGTPILRIDDYQIYWQRPRLDLNLVEADSSEVEQYSLRPDDVVINRVNSMTHLGKSLLISSLLEGVLFESNMMRLHMSTQSNASYVVYYLGSQTGRTRLTRDAKWAVNQASINQQDVRRTPIPLPSNEEQSEIVATLRAQLSALSNQSEAIVFSLKQSAAQRKNILRAAFSGQLVPQDPNDEPASALLARIRAQREAGERVPALKRGRKPKETA